jgi:hypothetical protein
MHGEMLSERAASLGPVHRVIATCRRNAWLCLSLLAVAAAEGACGSDDRRFESDQGTAGTGQNGGASGQGGSAAGQGGSGQGGSAAGQAGTGSGGAGTGGVSGEGGTAGATEECADGAACELLGGPGLCRGGRCLPCTDGLDDAACELAYADGVICAGGRCQLGCHDSSTCEGRICDPASFTCRGCTRDGECPSEAPYCNVDDGTCNEVAPGCTDENAPCAAGSGWCCGGTCHPQGGCCSDDDCGDLICNALHLCMPAGCTDPAPADRFYVNSDPPGGLQGVGSLQCPFNSLDTALAHVPSIEAGDLSATFTLCTQGTFSGRWPLYMPPQTLLDGNYCDPGVTTRTRLEVSEDSSGVVFTNPVAGGMHGYDIVHQVQNNSKFGLVVGARPFTLYDVGISGFAFGIAALGEADLLIQGGVQSRQNTTGLYVEGQATVLIDVSEDETVRSVFSQNSRAGINAVNQATLTIRGRVYTGPGSNGDPMARTVIANNNGAYGLELLPDAKAEIDHFGATGNSQAGIYTASFGTFSLRNSVLRNNGVNGLIVDTSPQTANLSALDLGSSATGAGAGNNYIFGNTGAGICLPAETTGRLKARGNSFSQNSNKDCRLPAPTTPLTHDPDCSTKVDTTRHLRIDVDNCSFE